MNTVGKPDTLGAQIRCVVSVAMLTEGWDANTVTHILGVRAFGTQLLCEQVVGRALRRQSYELNEDGLFDVEYADILGIPFDFTAKPVISKPQTPERLYTSVLCDQNVITSKSRFLVSKDIELSWPQERLTAEFNEDSVLVLSPDAGWALDYQKCRHYW